MSIYGTNLAMEEFNINESKEDILCKLKSLFDFEDSFVNSEDNKDYYS